MGGGAIIRLLNTNALEITELVVNNDIGKELLIETFSPACTGALEIKIPANQIIQDSSIAYISLSVTVSNKGTILNNETIYMPEFDDYYSDHFWHYYTIDLNNYM